MAQQTAVEWLVNELLFIQNLKEDEITESNKAILTTLTLEQAKQMEKEQIIDAYSLGYGIGYDDAKFKKSESNEAEQYYNETYGKDI